MPYKLAARIRSARSACSFSSLLVEARRDACCAALSLCCTVALSAGRTLRDVLLMVLFEVWDKSQAALLPGMRPVSEIFARAASNAAPAELFL